MDFLNDTKTVEERNLLLSEIDFMKRRDESKVRVSVLDNLKKIDLNDLKTKLQALETVKIIIAIEPTLGIMEVLEEFFKASLKERVLLDLEVNKEIVGGVQVIYKGKYADFSLLNKLDGSI